MLNLVAMVLSVMGLVSYYNGSSSLLTVAGVLCAILSLCSKGGIFVILFAGLLGGLIMNNFWQGCFLMLCIGEAINAFFLFLFLLEVQKR